MVQYLFDKFKICIQLVLFIIKESTYQCDTNLMVAQILQNIIFSIEAFCRLCVALIPISQTSICILTYIDISTLLSQKTLTHVHPQISPGHFPWMFPPTFRPGHNPLSCSFIPGISIAPLQALYYSEALPATARILYRSFTPKRTGNCR